MAFCTKCGAQTENDASLCPACSQSEPEKKAANVADIANAAGDLLGNTVEAVMNTKDETASFDAKDIQDNKLMALLSYIFILFLIPLFACKQSAFAQYHAKQGANLCILGLVPAVVFWVLGALLGGVPVLNAILYIISTLVSLALLCLMVLGIYYAATGKAKELPVVSAFKVVK